MAPRDVDRANRRRRVTSLVLAASEVLYGTLLTLYPKAFRSRYASEMRRDFRELSREELEQGGVAELARVWASTLSDLLVTALKERATASATRSVHPFVDPRIFARAMAAVVLVAVVVTVASLSITPRYKASTKLLVGQQGSAQPTLEMQHQDPQQLTLTLAEAARSRPIAEDTIERLELSATPDELLVRLDAEPIENTQFIKVSYTDRDPQRARLVANTVSDVLSQRVSEMGPSSNDATTATLWERARFPEVPVSPNPLRNGFLTLVSGLVLCLGFALALSRIEASGIGRVALRATSGASRREDGARWISAVPSATEAAKEKELLEALGRRGALTVAGVALETSLTVEEAERMLSALAAKGHLEVRVAHGRLLYSLWDDDKPL